MNKSDIIIELEKLGFEMKTTIGYYTYEYTSGNLFDNGERIMVKMLPCGEISFHATRYFGVCMSSGSNGGRFNMMNIDKATLYKSIFKLSDTLEIKLRNYLIDGLLNG